MIDNPERPDIESADEIAAFEQASGISAENPSFVNRIVGGALKRPLLTAIFAVLLIFVGVWSFLRLPVDAYPDLSPPQVEIITRPKKSSG